MALGPTKEADRKGQSKRELRVLILQILAETDPKPVVVGRGLLLITLLTLGLTLGVVVLTLVSLARRRARIRSLKEETKRRLAEDPWKASAERTEVPSADELYRASGFDKDDTRIEDSPKFGDGDERGPDESGGWDPKPKRPKRPRDDE